MAVTHNPELIKDSSGVLSFTLESNCRTGRGVYLVCLLGHLLSGPLSVFDSFSNLKGPRRYLGFISDKAKYFF